MSSALMITDVSVNWERGWTGEELKAIGAKVCEFERWSWNSFLLCTHQNCME